MTKKIEPGMPCIIRGSMYNDGRIVTPLERTPSMRWVDTRTGREFNAPGWEVAEQLVKKTGVALSPTDNNPFMCEERVMYPLDNPGDDEVDVFPLSRTLVKESHE